MTARTWWFRHLKNGGWVFPGTAVYWRHDGTRWRPIEAVCNMPMSW